MARYEVVTGCPVPAELAEELREIVRLSGASLNSCYRGDDARALLNRLGKKSQAQLYADFLAGRGNPANPPGFSTHECRNDGTAYGGWRRGAKIPYWAVGQDWNDPGAAKAAARKRGWIATSTYPNSRGEAQHVNFRKEPKFNPFKPIKEGATGIRVRQLTARLAYLGLLPGVSTKVGVNKWGPKTTAAVKHMQQAHHLPVDGILGVHTDAQIKASVKAKKARRQAAADLEKKVLDGDEKHNLKVLRDSKASQARRERARKWLTDRAHHIGVLGRNDGWAKNYRGPRYQILTEALK